MHVYFVWKNFKEEEINIIENNKNLDAFGIHGSVQLLYAGTCGRSCELETYS